MTREEIKEAIRCCAAHRDVDDCAGCPYRSGEYVRNGCENTLLSDALTLVEELETSLANMQRTVYELTSRQ